MSATYTSINEVQDSFVCWLVELGIPPDSSESIRLDGQKHRYRIKGDRAGERNGEYRVFMDDRPAGYAKSYSAKHGVDYETWAYQKENETPWTPEERKKYFEEQQKIREAAEREAELARARAIALAIRKWDSATEPDPKNPHPYIRKKKLAGTYGARVLGSELLIPGYNVHGEILTVQTIDLKRDPSKKFMDGTRKHGTFFPLGVAGPSEGEREVFVCEGFATGASIHEATGRPVVVAWDRGNLYPVVSSLRARYPGRLVLAPDNDRKTVGNPGMAAAFEILEEFGIPFVMPEFAEGEEGSDWNDYAALHDIERTAEAIFTALEDCRKNPELEAHYAWPKWISTAKNGAPLGTKENLEVLLEHRGIRIWYDEIKKDTRCDLPGHMNGNGTRFGKDNEQNSTLALIVSLCEAHRYPVKNLPEYLAAIADENRVNPARRWILSRTWDGKDRIETLCGTLQLADWYPDDMKRILVRRWLVSAVAASLSGGGFRARGVLVLQGSQGIGKTSWFAGLVPQDSGWFLDGVALNPDEKDSLKKVVSHWIIELGELDATFRRADISKLKSFITSPVDVVRLPWARKFSEFPRRTVFCASVNQADFLVDTTGNSRWWVLPCRKIEFRHVLDMQQLWAQVYRIWNEEKIWWLNQEEETRLNELNRQFEASDEIEDLIAGKWNWDEYEKAAKMEQGGWLNATAALKLCGLQNPTKTQVRRAGEILRALTGREPQRMGKAGDRCYWIPNATR